MEARLARIENDIITLYKAQKRQEENSRNLNKLTSSLDKLLVEMQYMREDLTEIKDDYKSITREVREHVTGDLTGQLGVYDTYKTKAISSFITIIISSLLGAVLALIFK